MGDRLFLIFFSLREYQLNKDHFHIHTEEQVIKDNAWIQSDILTSHSKHNCILILNSKICTLQANFLDTSGSEYGLYNNKKKKNIDENKIITCFYFWEERGMNFPLHLYYPDSKKFNANRLTSFIPIT